MKHFKGFASEEIVHFELPCCKEICLPLPEIEIRWYASFFLFLRRKAPVSTESFTFRQSVAIVCGVKVTRTQFIIKRTIFDLECFAWYYHQRCRKFQQPPEPWFAYATSNNRCIVNLWEEADKRTMGEDTRSTVTGNSLPRGTSWRFWFNLAKCNLINYSRMQSSHLYKCFDLGYIRRADL